MLTPRELYKKHLAEQSIIEDPKQTMVVCHLERLFQELINTQKISYKLSKLFKKKSIQGLYIWGGVGRGKTFLVDLFYDCVPFKHKLRLHFHRFMRMIHDELKNLKGIANPLEKVSKRLVSKYKIICFDEFFVSDIADAMLLGELFNKLLNSGVVLVATSNIPPSDLYKNGLQRQCFIPTIKLLEKYLDIIEMNGSTDYRLRTLSKAEIFHTPADNLAFCNLEKVFLELAPDKVLKNEPIYVDGREIMSIAVADDVVWFDFFALCDGPRSTTDYIELARCYHTVLLSNMPVLQVADEDKARRFIALIDEFYDRNVKLIITADSECNNLYQGNLLKFDFKRTLSRLTEMQSHEYLALEHKA